MCSFPETTFTIGRNLGIESLNIAETRQKWMEDLRKWHIAERKSVEADCERGRPLLPRYERGNG